MLAAIGIAGVLALMLGAVLQHRFDYQPCPWCVLQRLTVMVVVVMAAAGALIPGLASRILSTFVCLIASISGVGVALYQHWVAARSASCDLTLADRLISRLGLADLWPAMFEATARCDEADRPWLGVPFSLWGALLFALLALVAALALIRLLRRDAAPA